MSEELKAIPTKYAGIEFRSRLEARWAVFFDALKVEWEYEPEGYELSSGRYLPDFVLPQLKCFFEVKPGDFQGGDPRHEELSRMAQRNVFVALGMPRPDLMHRSEGCIAYLWDGIDVVFDQGFFFCICRACRTVMIHFGGFQRCHCRLPTADDSFVDDPILRNAYSRALSFKFDLDGGRA